MGCFTKSLLFVTPLLGCLYYYALHAQFTSGIVPMFHVTIPHGFSANGIPDLTGKVALVTGANSGVGLGTAKHLLRNHATVVMACRSPHLCAEAAAEVTVSAPGTKGSTVPMNVDLSSLASVRTFAAEYRAKGFRLDMLYLNAGIMATPYALSVDGIEMQFATNHVGHFELVAQLLDMLEASAPSRIVSVSSAAHMHAAGSPLAQAAAGVPLRLEDVNDAAAYSPASWYGQSKLANVLFANELQRKLAGKRIYVNSIHPGGVQGKLLRPILAKVAGMVGGGERFISAFTNFVEMFYWDIETGALTSLYPGTSPEIEAQDVRGAYFIPIARRWAPSDLAVNGTLGEDLWAFTERIIRERAPKANKAT